MLVLTVLGSFRETPSQGNSVKGVTRSVLEGARLFLNSDSTVGQGDKKLVNIIEDWDVLAEYAGDKLGFYQLLAGDKTFEIRVQTGRLGFKKEFSTEDTELEKINGSRTVGPALIRWLDVFSDYNKLVAHSLSTK